MPDLRINRKSRLLSGVFTVWATLIAPSVIAQTSRPGTQPATSPSISEPIRKLIVLLGDPSGAEREQATQELSRLGETVLPALREAMRDPDPEIDQRAQAIYQAITNPSPERIEELRAAAAKAIAEKDFAEAARRQSLLALRPRPTVDECLAVGTDWGLADHWPEAVGGYQRALRRIEEVLAGDPESDPPPPTPPAHFGNNGNGDGIGAGPGHIGPIPLTDYQKRELAQKRAELIVLIGALQRDKLSDPKAAMATFNRVIAIVPEFQTKLDAALQNLVDDYPKLREIQRTAGVPWPEIERLLALVNESKAMEELARLQEQDGQIDAAALTLARVNHVRFYNHPDESLGELGRLIRRSPTISKLPAATALLALLPAPAPKPAKD